MAGFNIDKFKPKIGTHHGPSLPEFGSRIKRLGGMASGGMVTEDSAKGKNTMKMSPSKFEGTKKDTEQDKKLAAKHKMSFSDWEKSPGDKKHDEQQSMKGLKKGGSTSKMVKKAKGGGIESRGKTRGKFV